MKLGFVLLLLCAVGIASGQTITTSAITGSPFCAGQTINVPFTVTGGSFNVGNQFTVEMGTGAGFASPVTLAGSLSGTGSGTVVATIPISTTTAANYRFRVIASSPAVTGSNNGTNLTVNAVGLAAPTVTGSPFCAGSTFNITNNLSNACPFGAGNTFTVQLSDSGGAFGAPTAIGSASSTTGGTISVTLPLNLTGSANYRMRVVSSNPSVTGTQSATFTVTALGIAAPTVSGAPFCQGSTFNITNNLSNACAFGSGNNFTVQLSDAGGSFASPSSIGSVSSTTGGTISVTIPAVNAGTGYLMRVVSSNPVLTGTSSAAFSIGTVLNAPTFAGAPFCAGTTFNVTNNLGAGCSFNSGNVFTVQLSNAAGSFAAPTNVGSATTTTGGSISVTIPNTTVGGAGYLFRIVSTNPAITSPSSTAFTVTAIGLNAPTVAGSPFCVGSTFNITNNLSSACSFDPTNTFTVQLSDGAGSFASPTTIGTAANTSTGGTISVTIPMAQASGNAYRIRVVASNPSVTSPINGANLTISPLLTAPTGIPATLCQGATFNINNNLSAGTGCSFNSGNNFNVQLSDAAGNFASPTVIGTATNTTTGGVISVTIPFPTATGAGYRIRVVGTNPVVTGPDNGANLTVSDFAINAPTFAGTTFCPNQTFNVNYTLLNSCAFPNTPSNNVFTAQLSNSAGSFGTPTDIGSVTASTAGAISVTIPVGITPGNGYRIRVISSNPTGGRISPDNGTNLTINAIGLNAPTGIGATYCANATFNITNVLSSACNFVTGNTFTAQLSDATGSFASPTNISSAISATAGGTISVTLPANATTSSNYRIQVVSTNPVRTSISSGTFTINALAITAPTITGGTTTFCQGQNFTVNYTVNCTFPAGNVFTAQLSDAVGSFASPVTVGTITSTGSGSISANIGSPVAGTGYRIRVISSNPSGVLSPDNGVNLTVNASAGTPSAFGNGVWNAYVYSGQALSSNPNTINSNIYLGRYIENNLSFNTQTRWGNTAGPVAADASQGAGNAYQGCPHPGPVGQQYSVSLKRTNIPCGYYQIDIPGHDDDVRVFIDGAQVFAHVGCCDSHTNVWTGFINPATTVEFQFQNGAGPGYLQVNIAAAPSPLTISPSIVQCSTPSTPATLTVSSPLSLTYAWTPTTGLTPSNGLGASVVAAPSTTTTYTVTGTDAVSGCSVSGTTTVTISNATPVVSVTNSAPTFCSGINTTTLTASGASTYTWSPTTGLSFPGGGAYTGTAINSALIADPPSTTTYTVIGNNGCTNSAPVNVTATVQVRPSSPPSTGAASFGNNTWNVFCHYNNTTYSNLYGYYTENNVSFNTTTRWANGAGPSVANAASGLAYSGCSFVAPAVSTNYSMSFRRTNFTCGYYQVNVDFQDDQFTMLVDGVQVFQNNGYTPTLQTNVWTGFLGPSSQVELRLINNNGPGQLQVTFLPSSNRPQTINTDITVCAGTNAALSATSSLVGATYSWSYSPNDGNISFSPSANQANPFLQTTASAASSYTVTNTLTDAGGTGCTASRSFTLTVDPLPNTAVTPTAATVSCPTATTTLTASGAASYTWSPATGLSATTGFSVIANPTTTTTYTVTGSNNCATNSATTTITVIPLPAITTFPTGTWNVYGFNSQTIGTNYQGYYTENGSGATGLNFDTRTRWASGAAPSTANGTNGTAWLGCTMNASNISISAKRTGFTCGVYQIDIPAHDDDFYLLINGVQVARHNGCCDTHTNVWTGVLNSSSTVEFQMQQGGGGSYLQVAFTLITQPVGTTVWLGGTSNDWFTASNWCGGVPTSTTDALIPAAGPQNMPLINNNGAVARNVTINPSVQFTGTNLTTPVIAAASLTTNSVFGINVHGNWANNGNFVPNSGTVSFLGSNVGNTISSTGTNTFFSVFMNKANPITISAGTHQIGGALTFSSGIVNQNATLQFLNGSTTTGASNTSYINGVVTKIGTNAFTFPVGASNLYRPIAISSPGTSTTFTAQYVDTNPNALYPNAQRAVTLDHVSGAEYWLLNRTAGTANVNVTLSWGSNSGGVGNLSSLRVAAWNGSIWTDQGNSATTGNTSAGTVTSNVSSVYGPYTLATIDNSNPLPVVLSDFNCQLIYNFVEVRWSTQSEVNSDYFDVERSENGINFYPIERVTAAGNSLTRKSYSIRDYNVAPGFAYYRLKQVDRDNSFTYYQVCVTEVPNDNNERTLHPNPASTFTAFNLKGKELISLTVMNSIGETMNCSHSVSGGKVIVNLTSLVPGVYMVETNISGEIQKLKLVIQR